MQALRISVYVLALVAANLLVLHWGPWGLTFTAFFLIPFDFVMRAALHETWQGRGLWLRLGLLIFVSSLITYGINHEAAQIAKASALAFITAQVSAGIVYQFLRDESFLVKVNISDFVGILCDSIVFQFVAFCWLDAALTCSQVFLKVTGGLLWYYILFERLRVQDKW